MEILTLLDLSKKIVEKRKEAKMTQKDLSLASGVGTRFIVNLENGKETCEIGKALKVVKTLGIKLEAE